MSGLSSIMFEERPIIFFDSHPEPPAGIIWDSISHIKKQLTIAWTGDVVLDVQPGLLRLQWYTSDGKFGKRDYEIREFEEVRRGFEELCKLDEVSRTMIVGYPSQNPYSMFGESEYAIHEKKKRDILNSAEYRDFVPKAKKGPSVSQQIDDIINADTKKQEVDQKHPSGAEDV
ncbi:hypothetical protein ANO11243_095650 [Dothideomycetidae sp. 11243]|nr:hypothetical protein ANO11243_095650 [fungal sp. No.11243]